MPHESLTHGAPDGADASIRSTLRDLIRPGSERLVLAISGGGDSMALLHAAARYIPELVAAVATFDHATGAAARAAVELVADSAARLGFPLEHGRAPTRAHTESAWRRMRWAFLRDVAERREARIATAHTSDDQLETIVQRLLRGTGTRGLAALAAPGPIVRPWLTLSRATVRAYRERHGIATVTDPANTDRRHQRVRVRLDLLPALERATPGFGAAMLALGAQAAVWRREADALVATLPWEQQSSGVWRLERAAVAGWSAAALAVLWPALLADLGVPLSGEGTERLVRFTIGDARAGELRVSGGVTVVRQPSWFSVRTAAVAQEVARARVSGPQVVSAGAPVAWPGWSIAPGVPSESGFATGRHSELDAGWAAFPVSQRLEVRRWEAGDRICTSGAPAGRRISRYLSEAGVPRGDRRGWPIVLYEGQVVWVPGIVRGLAAPHRSGRSDLIWYRSDRECS